MASPLISPEGLRGDGRRPMELRRLRVSFAANAPLEDTPADGASGASSFALCDGHASFTSGQTTCTALVLGTREASRFSAALSAEEVVALGDVCGGGGAAAAAGGGVLFGGARAYGTIAASVTHVGFARSKRPASNVSSFAGAGRRAGLSASAWRKTTLEEEHAEVLRSTLSAVVDLKLYAESEIAVHVDVVSGDGGELAASLNAAFLALLDAGIAVTNPMAAVTVGVFPSASKETQQQQSDGNKSGSEPTIMLDLTSMEYDMCSGVRATVAYYDRGDVAALVLDGAPTDQTTIDGLVKTCQSACRAVSQTMRTASLSMLKERAIVLC